MRRNAWTFVVLGTVLSVSMNPVIGQSPMPQLGGPMKHLMITLNDNAIVVDVQGDPQERVALHRYDEAYDWPADILDGVSYGGRYGWMAGGFIRLPADRFIWIELVEQTPGLETYEALTFDAILSTGNSDSIWPWSGAMTHNWYAATMVGQFDATYRVYVGDLAGGADPSFDSAFVTLHWETASLSCGDYDGDADVDLADYLRMVTCFDAAGDSVARECMWADCDLDGDVDLGDVITFQSQYTGSQ